MPTKSLLIYVGGRLLQAVPILFVIILIITGIQMRVGDRFVYYEGGRR